jgi:molybdopterin-guanine dinucleotide biosynthesis protein A
MSEIIAGILVGGHSKRIGQDKAALEFGDTTLICRIYNVLKQTIKTIRVVGGSQRNYNLPENLFIEDIVKNAGPMGGLLSILKKTNKPTLLVPCDTPFIESEHIRFLLANYKKDMAGTIAVSDKGIEPLLGIYQPQLIPVIKKLISLNDLALYRIFDIEKVNFVDFSVAGYNSDIFFNINTLKDYKKALYLREQIENKNDLNTAGGKNG